MMNPDAKEEAKRRSRRKLIKPCACILFVIFIILVLSFCMWKSPTIVWTDM